MVCSKHAGDRHCRVAGRMNPDDDPPSQDDAEGDWLDEPMTLIGRIVIGVLITVEITWMLTVALFRSLRRSVFVAFKDVKR